MCNSTPSPTLGAGPTPPSLSRIHRQLSERRRCRNDGSFPQLLKNSPMMAYLAMMAPRLVELHRVLKETGSLYLHCDPTADHYLRMLLDGIFGAVNFRDEIIWKRRVGMSSAVHESNRFGVCTDILLFYAKSDAAEFNPQYNKDSPEYQEYIRERFTMVD